ncbi:MAG: CvpA family protein [Phycisphaerales bacterium]|nr:CvpA family protein [Phycisphaerales bacterium]
MIVLFNVIVLSFVLLIAYWWANQGLFSALLHCLCVIVAGAIALAFWEPVVLGFLLKGGAFDNYAWGMALGGIFVISLFVLRLISDSLIPFDVPLPQVPNTIGGGIFGFVAGVITIGVTSIACGFVQGPTELIGFIGVARGADSRGAPMTFNAPWLPVANLTETFYRQLSLGALSPIKTGSLATHAPRLADTALSLHRDTFNNGDARTSIAPQDVVVRELMFDPHFVATDGSTDGAYAVEVIISTGGFDGEQFVLSCAQARLANSDLRPRVAYPTKFNQPALGGGTHTFTFDDIGNYATSIPGEQDVTIVLLFPATEFVGKSPPNLFTFKGLRYPLALPTADTDLATRLAGDGDAVVIQDDTNADGGFVPDVTKFIAPRNSIRPAELNINLADTMTVATSDAGNFLSGGKGVYGKGSKLSISRTQRIRGFNHAEGTEVIMVDASRREDGIDIWGDGSPSVKALGRDLALELVDSKGKGYKPTGYVWERQGDVEIRFEPSKPFQRLADLPPQPSSGEQTLKLVFVVPTDIEIVGIRVGKTLVGTCTVIAKGGRTD